MRTFMEEMREEERELRKLRSMFPDAAKLLLPYVEEECDKMEYEGSPMFDEYPDRTTIYRLEERIYGQVKDRFPEEPERKPEEILALQYLAAAPDGFCRNLARDMTRVLLLQEMHHRRRRHAAVRGAALSGTSEDGK